MGRTTPRQPLPHPLPGRWAYDKLSEASRPSSSMHRAGSDLGDPNLYDADGDVLKKWITEETENWNL